MFVAKGDVVALNATGVEITLGGAVALLEDATRYVIFGRRHIVRGTVLYGPRDVRFEERPDPTLIEPTDAILQISAACVCGSAPVRHFLPELIDLIWSRKINPGKVFDLTLPLDQVAEGYRVMDERRAIKALLRP
jgi:threonine dehydrogenase-like Zn-dependent dehydrogenase